mgnify:CR=1 FL=1
MTKVEELLKEGFRRKDEVVGPYNLYEKGFERVLYDYISGRIIKYEIRDNWKCKN